MDKKISVISDLDGKKIVVISDIRFKGKRNRRKALKIKGLGSAFSVL